MKSRYQTFFRRKVPAQFLDQIVSPLRARKEFLSGPTVRSRPGTINSTFSPSTRLLFC